MGSEIVVLCAPLGVLSLACLVYGFRAPGQRLSTFAWLLVTLLASLGVISFSGGSIAIFSVVGGLLLTLAAVVAVLVSAANAVAKKARSFRSRD